MDVVIRNYNEKQFRNSKEEKFNAQTIAAIEEGEDALKHPEKYDWYDNVDLMFEELLA